MAPMLCPITDTALCRREGDDLPREFSHPWGESRKCCHLAPVEPARQGQEPGCPPPQVLRSAGSCYLENEGLPVSGHSSAPGVQSPVSQMPEGKKDLAESYFWVAAMGGLS